MEKLHILMGCARYIKLVIFTGLALSLNSFVAKAQSGDGMYNAIDAGTIEACGGYGYFNDYQDTYYNSNTYGDYYNDIWYKFTITSATQVDMSHCGNGSGTYMYLLDEWGSEINSSYGYGPLCSSDEASLSEYLYPGTYYLVAEGNYYNGYIFTTISTSGGSIPTGSDFYNPIVIGQVTGYGFSDIQNSSDCFGDEIGQPNNDIYYQFSLSNPATVKLSHCGTSFDTYMHLLDASGNVIASNDDSGPLCSTLQASIKTTLPAGTYYLVSEGYGSNTGYITTSISLEVPGANFSNAIDAGAIAAGASYNDTKDNNPANGYSNEMGQPSDDIYYKFSINEPTNTEVTISLCGSSVNTYLHLLDASGNIITSDEYYGPVCYANRSSIRMLLGSGTYYVVSEGYGYNSGNLVTQISVGQPSGWTESNQNYVRTHVPRSSIADYSTLNSVISNKDLVQTSTQYLDGLGQPIQTVQRQASPAGYDLVQPVIYDAQGREYRKYLPYKAAATDGGFKIGAPHANVKAFYNPSSPGATGIATTAYPFAETVVEKTPLGRILEQGAPGEAWQPAINAAPNGGHTIKTDVIGNSYGEAKLWTISGTTCSATDYDWGTLLKITTTDENGNQSIEYKDKTGNVVFKQAEYESGLFTSTHYVYDDLNQLRYVIPPSVTALSFTEADAIFDQFIYAYHYDDQSRIIEKKIPGKGWEYLVYNQLGQVVLTQDAVQRQSNKWLYTRYDALGRLAMTGEYTSSSSRATLQAAVLAHSSGAYEIFTGAGTEGYSLNTFPQADYNIQTVNYYGTYNIPGKTNTYDASVSVSNRVNGLHTGSKIKVLGTSTFLLTVNYYDEYGRLKEAIEQNYIGGVDRIINIYSFIGELTNSSRVHSSSTANVTVNTRNTFDHTGRAKQSFQQINSDAEVKLVENNYNEIGQLISKTLHNDQQVTNYSYNPRGWLKTTNSSQFAMELKYEDGTTPQYNGNISNQLWGDGSLSNTFVYSYDKLNRLINGTSTGIAMSEVLTYDQMGNITSLARDGAAAGVYTYNGNRLNQITGGIATAVYNYDLNGNATFDGRTAVNMTYNTLNLPVNVSKSGLNIDYTYTALGKKLKKVSNGSTRDYVGGIEYNGSSIDIIRTEVGVARNNGGSYSYEYNLSDHLGNVRRTVYRNPVSGIIETIQKDDYYPFGERKIVSAGQNKYLYNGKELQEELGQVDFGARLYDPIIGRWNVADELSEKYYPLSPYNYVSNSPLKVVDPDGRDWFTYNGMYRWDDSRDETMEYDDHKWKNVGNSLTITTVSYINTPNDLPVPESLSGAAAGDKLITSVTLTGNYGKDGKFSGFEYNYKKEVGATFNIAALKGVDVEGQPNTAQGSGAWPSAKNGNPLNIFAHVTTPPIETLGLKIIGRNVDVNQELGISLDKNGFLKIGMAHGTYPSVNMKVGSTTWYNYQQQSFIQSHATKFWTVTIPLWANNPAFFIRMRQRELQAVSDYKTMNENYKTDNKIGSVKLNDDK